MPDLPSESEISKSAIQRAKQWGESSIPPTLLATLITAQHARPFQPLPMLFPPVLLFSSYLNINGFGIDAAGLTAAWSGLYALLAMRRKHRLAQRFGARGMVRGATLGLCAINLVGCGVAYAFGRRKVEEAERAKKGGGGSGEGGTGVGGG